MISLKNRSFLKLLDFTPDEISYLLDLDCSGYLNGKKESRNTSCLLFRQKRRPHL